MCAAASAPAAREQRCVFAFVLEVGGQLVSFLKIVSKTASVTNWFYLAILN